MVQISKQRRRATISEALFPPRLFRALADPSRVSLLAQLAAASRPLSVSELAGCCPTDLSVVSRHLAVLRDAGVVTRRKEGRHVLYTPCCRQLAEILRSMADAVDECCGALHFDGGAPSEEMPT